MKKFSLTRNLALAAVGLLLASAPLIAHEGIYKGGMDEKMMDKALSGLDLSSDQRSSLSEARAQHRQAMVAIVEHKEAHLKSLRQKSDGNATDEDLQASLADLKQDMKDTQDQQDIFMAKLEEILTAKQKAKMILDMVDKMKVGKVKE
jgi:Spy/CpxP family protein refolding chaperone